MRAEVHICVESDGSNQMVDLASSPTSASFHSYGLYGRLSLLTACFASLTPLTKVSFYQCDTFFVLLAKYSPPSHPGKPINRFA